MVTYQRILFYLLIGCARWTRVYSFVISADLKLHKWFQNWKIFTCSISIHHFLLLSVTFCEFCILSIYSILIPLYLDDNTLMIAFLFCNTFNISWCSLHYCLTTGTVLWRGSSWDLTIPKMIVWLKVKNWLFIMWTGMILIWKLINDTQALTTG